MTDCEAARYHALMHENAVYRGELTIRRQDCTRWYN